MNLLYTVYNNLAEEGSLFQQLHVYYLYACSLVFNSFRFSREEMART